MLDVTRGDGLGREDTRDVRVVEVIFVTYLRGVGRPDDPCRVVHRFYSKNGELLAEFDPCADGRPDVGGAVP